MPHTAELLPSLSESNIERFERLLAKARDDDERTTLVELIAEERESLKRLASTRKADGETSGQPGPP